MADFNFQINRLCVVCSDTASGIHYRVLTCEGCKGFWRRTIQRGMGPVYQCRQGAERCQVTPQSRGRCQRCRYLACVAAGMVADLVMSDRERLVKAKEVVNNRVKKDVGVAQRPGSVAIPMNSRDQEGQRLLTVAAALHQRFLATREVLGENQNIHKTISAANNFLELFLAELMGGRFISELISSAHMEVVLIHLAVSRPASSLTSLPLLSQLADHASSLTYQEVVLAQAVAATRPRLSWPPPDRYKLGEIWDILAEAVRRWSGATRLPNLLQLVMQAAFACCYIPQDTLIACLQPRQWPNPANRWHQDGWAAQQIHQQMPNKATMYQDKITGIYDEKVAGMYSETTPVLYPSPTESYVAPAISSPETIDTGSSQWQEQLSPGTGEQGGVTDEQAVTLAQGDVTVQQGDVATEKVGTEIEGQKTGWQDVRMPQPPAQLATIYKEVDYDVYGNNWHNGYKAPYQQPLKAEYYGVEPRPGSRPVPALHKITTPTGVVDDVDDNQEVVTGQEDVIVPDLIDSDTTDFVAAEVSSEDLYEPSSKKRRLDDVEEKEPVNDVLRQALVGVF